MVVMITLMIKFNDRIQLWSERPVKMHKDEIAIFAKSLALSIDGKYEPLLLEEFNAAEIRSAVARPDHEHADASA